MKNVQFPLWRSFLVIALSFAVLAGFTGTARADSPAFTWQNVTDTFVVFGSCSDPDGMYQITLVSSGAAHFVENGNGYKFRASEHGTFFIEPIDAASPVTYSGQYSDHFLDTGIFTGEKWAFNRTFISVGRGSDGTHEVFRFTNIWIVTPNGTMNDRESGFQWICN